MSEKEFLEKMASILDEEKVEMEDRLDDFDEWDSIAVVAFLVQYAEKSEKKISLMDMKNAETVRELYDLM